MQEVMRLAASESAWDPLSAVVSISVLNLKY